MIPTTASTAHLEQGNEYSVELLSGRIKPGGLRPLDSRQSPVLVIHGDKGLPVKVMPPHAVDLDNGRRVCNECRAHQLNGRWWCVKCGVER